MAMYIPIMCVHMCSGIADTLYCDVIVLLHLARLQSIYLCLSVKYFKHIHINLYKTQSSTPVSSDNI